MTCKDCRRSFSEAYDGEDREGVVSSHVASCAACREDYRRYAETLAEFSGFLHRAADGAMPRRPFPQLAPSALASVRAFWLKTAALGLTAAAAVVLGLWRPVSAPPLEPASGPRLQAGGHPVAEAEARCDWKREAPRDLPRLVTYPVVADDCLAADFELVEASVRRCQPCPEDLRLTYRAGNRSFVLEQHPETTPAVCSGERVLVDEIVGCFERLGLGATSLRWLHRNHAFHLEGEVGPAEAIQVARAISRDFEAR